MKKIQVWAVATDWNKIVKRGFKTSADAYNWMVINGIDGIVCRVWM